MSSLMLRAPDLSEDRLIGFVSGLRPCRRGGLRIEAETLGSDAGGVTVVHNYGQGGCGVTIGFGCAQIAADLVESGSEDGAPVAVLGAGVIGLTTAWELARRGRSVRLFGEKLGSATTSNIAGALWLPTGIEFGTSDDARERFRSILHASHDSFQRLDRGRFGVERLPVYEPAGTPLVEEFFDNGTIDRPRVIERLPVGAEVQGGRVFETDFVHTPRFLREVEAEVRRLGVTIESRRFVSVKEIAGLDEQILVNCLAMGSRALFDDSAVYPARGMLVHMDAQDLGYIVHDGYRYLFPREDRLVLGGCFQEEVWESEPDEAYCREILRHHRAFFGQD